jgi:hypothetical protein
MDTGGIAKIPAATAPTPLRADIVHPGAVRTELPPEAAVRPADAAEAVRFEPARDLAQRAALDAALQDMIRRNIEIDPRTREVVEQVVDQSTGRVVRQTPEEALLRLRAYARELREPEEAGDGTRRVEKIA